MFWELISQGGQVLVSNDIYNEASSASSLSVLGQLREIGCIALRGIAAPEVIYEVMLRTDSC